MRGFAAQLRPAVFAALLVAPAGVVGLAGDLSAAESQPRGLRIRMGPGAGAVERAIRGAQERFARPECQKLLTDFTDAAGRPLQASLDDLGSTAAAYLELIGFYDGESKSRCRGNGVAAFTQPGSRVVFVCPGFGRQGLHADEIVILHEALHSLGLGENPPTPSHISMQVAMRCPN